MNTIRVVIADDHAVVRQGVRKILKAACGIEVIAEAANGEEALKAVEAHSPDVLIADIAMPGLTGLELSDRIAREFPQTRVLILTIHEDEAYATRAMATGASGYLLKDAGAAEYEFAVRAVARGESYLSPLASAHLVAAYSRLARADAAASDPLTERQRAVLSLIVGGLPAKSVARRLDISIRTVEAHRSKIMQRLGIHDLPGLVRYALRTGIITEKG